MAVEHHSEPAPEITQAQIRQIIESEIERLIGVLDLVDPDPDLEDGDEDDDKSDFEPSLGSLERFSQMQWSHGNIDDYEDEHDGAEPCCEDEGAQCDDEGCPDADLEWEYESENWVHPESSEIALGPCGGSVVPPSPRDRLYRQDAYAHEASTTKKAQSAIEEVRTVMARHGKAPIPPLRVLGDAIVKW